MRAYSARHITRLASYNGTPNIDEDLMNLIKFDPDFTNPRIFKLQIMVDASCDVLINGNSEVTISEKYGLIIEYTQLTEALSTVKNMVCFREI